jgi:heme A synthase
MGGFVGQIGSDRAHSRLGRWAWALLGYAALVIAFGAFVRATNSGDGCGAHWPLCNGEVIPLNPTTERLIEFTHRASSGLFGLGVFALLVATLRAFKPGSAVRRAMIGAMIFTIVEALIGALLVKQGWVAENSSPARAVGMALHLCNTFLLLASLASAAYLMSGGKAPQWKGQGSAGWALLLSLAGVMILGASGAVTALGDTLFPSETLAEGIRRDLSPTAPGLIALRIVHPLIATSVVMFLILAARFVTRVRPSANVKRFSGWVAGLALAQMAFGVLNFVFMAPVWM